MSISAQYSGKVSLIITTKILLVSPLKATAIVTMTLASL